MADTDDSHTATVDDSHMATDESNMATVSALLEPERENLATTGVPKRHYHIM